MTNRFSSRWLRTAFVGASLALLGAVMLFASPHGAEAAKTTKEQCASNGAVADAANNPGLVSDCAALLNSKDVLMGSEGKIRTLNWSSSLPMSKWDGVTVGALWLADGAFSSYYEMPNRVTALRLYGPLPLAYLRAKGELAQRVATAHLLRGSIPPQLGKLSELRVLGLGNNRLNGKIPKQLGNLSELRELWLYSNELSGSVPRQLSRLSNLKELGLGDNQLSGKIPPRLSRLSKLESLQLYENKLRGGIPKQLGNLTNLTRLWLFRNQLSGNIPPELGKLTKLENLQLYENLLTGSIPPKLGKIRSLRRLWLSGNNLSGCVPETLRHLSNDRTFGFTVMYPPGETDYASGHNILPWCGDVD